MAVLYSQNKFTSRSMKMESRLGVNGNLVELNDLCLYVHKIVFHFTVN